jgi:hypothetical protein
MVRLVLKCIRIFASILCAALFLPSYGMKIYWSVDFSTGGNSGGHIIGGGF